MRQYEDSISSAINGLPVYQAQVFLQDAGGTPVQIYSDEGVTPLAQPVLTDGLGFFSFFVPDGTYTLVVADPDGSNPRSFPKTEIYEDARNVSVPVSETGVTLPSIGDRAGRLLGFDGAGLPIGVAASASDLAIIASIAPDIESVADNMAAVTTVSANLLGANTIGVVSTNIANVNVVGGSIAAVNTVAGSIANVNAVAGNATNINAVAANAANINTVAGSAASVNVVAADLALGPGSSYIIRAPQAASDAAAAAAAFGPANGHTSVTYGFQTALLPNGSAWPTGSCIYVATSPNGGTLTDLFTQIGTVGSGAANVIIASGASPTSLLTFIASYSLSTVTTTGLQHWNAAAINGGTPVTVPVGALVLIGVASGGVGLVQDATATGAGFTRYGATTTFTSGTKTLTSAANIAFRARMVVNETALQVPRAGLVDATAMGLAASTGPASVRVLSSAVSTPYGAKMNELGAVAFSNNQCAVIGTVTADGPLESIYFDCGTSIGTGLIDLVVLNGTLPDVEVVSSTSLTVVGGRNVFTAANFGTINLVSGNSIMLRTASGGPTLIEVPGAGFYYNSASNLASGAGRLVLVASFIIRAGFTVLHPALVLGKQNLGPELRGLTALSTPGTPKTWMMFLIAGQSNAQGANPQINPESVPAGWAYQYYSGSLTALTNDPVGNAAISSAWISFINRFIALTGMGVILVPAAVGGSGLAVTSATGNWSSTGALRGAAITALNAAQAAATSAALAYQFGGILWSQGETDADGIDAGTTALVGGPMSQAKYEAEFALLYAYFQAQAGAGTPMVISRTGYKSSGDTAGYVAVRASQMSFARTYPYIGIGYTGALNWTPRGEIQSTYHGTTVTYCEMGISMATTAAARCLGRA